MLHALENVAGMVFAPTVHARATLGGAAPSVMNQAARTVALDMANAYSTYFQDRLDASAMTDGEVPVAQRLSVPRTRMILTSPAQDTVPATKEESVSVMLNGLGMTAAFWWTVMGEESGSVASAAAKRASAAQSVRSTCVLTAGYITHFSSTITRNLQFAAPKAHAQQLADVCVTKAGQEGTALSLQLALEQTAYLVMAVEPVLVRAMIPEPVNA